MEREGFTQHTIPLLEAMEGLQEVSGLFQPREVRVEEAVFQYTQALRKNTFTVPIPSIIGTYILGLGHTVQIQIIHLQ